jgi:hypothetical protein
MVHVAEIIVCLKKLLIGLVKKLVDNGLVGQHQIILRHLHRTDNKRRNPHLHVPIPENRVPRFPDKHLVLSERKEKHDPGKPAFEPQPDAVENLVVVGGH